MIDRETGEVVPDVVDDGWHGDRQRFATALQTVAWVDCPECGAMAGHWCYRGQPEPGGGDVDLVDLAVPESGKKVPSCRWRRRAANRVLRSRQKGEVRKREQIRRAVRWYEDETAKGQGELF